MKALRLTALGGVVLTAIVFRDASLVALILMLAAGVGVPLGLALVIEGEAPSLPTRVLPYVAPLSSAGAVLGWTAAPGSTIAIAGAAVHAATCACAGLLAVARIWPMVVRRALDPLPELAIDLGLLFLPAASVWLLASRAGVPLAGFQEPVVTFTAAHFHVAGFAAPTVIGVLGRRLERRGMLYDVAAIAVCAGVPLTAIGIATNHTIEQGAAILVATGMLAASASLIAYARRAPSLLAKALFVVSGSTLLVTMTLAAIFALTSSAGRGSSLHGAVEIETMLRYHAAANTIGFALAALAALSLTPLTPRPLRPSPPAPASR